MSSIYKDLARRTGDTVMIGVVGPTRTGKSTFVKRIMETIVIPNIEDPLCAERARDEMPQCGSGRMITTAEPKFVPEEAVEICPDGVSRFHVRMIDSVGYVVPGALGAEEDGEPRMVTTPWLDTEIPMAEAAEIGTKKVMENHSTIGIIVTTDGSITDLEREQYETAEEQSVRDMKETGKPFLVLLNSANPDGEETKELRERLAAKYDVPVISANCQTMQEQDILDLLKSLLMEFPVTEIKMYLPSWLNALENEYPLKEKLYEAMLEMVTKCGKISELQKALNGFAQEITDAETQIEEVDLGQGSVTSRAVFPKQMFFDVLSEKCGMKIRDDGELMKQLAVLSSAKQSYEKVEAALEQVRQTGYGIVQPTEDEMQLSAPELIRHGNHYSLRLRASAPSIHMICSKKKRSKVLK